MLNHRPDPITGESFRRLHPNTIEEPAQILRFLQRLRDAGVELQRGTNQRADPELARIREVREDRILLTTKNFRSEHRDQVLLNSKLDGRPYFFTAPQLQRGEGGNLELGVPALVYEAERRDRERRQPAPGGGGGPRRVRLQNLEAEVADFSADGLAVILPEDTPAMAGDALPLRYLDGEMAGQEAYAQVRGTRTTDRPGWKRIGLSVVPTPQHAALQVERRDHVLPPSTLDRAIDGWSVLTARVRGASRRRLGLSKRSEDAEASVRIADFENSRGESIRAIVDTWGDPRGAPAVIIPPAWGKTKETLLPLARTIVATFRRARRPVSVLRLDGIRKRGESYNDPECRHPGRENLRYTFSQGADDILATVEFLERSAESKPSTIVLVSFSVAAIEGRRAIFMDQGARIGGWVSVVGAPDPQSLIRVISGGVDYLGGVERGVRFGLQDVQGLLLDIDRTGREALKNRIAFLDDARREMSSIQIPITWIHGRHDAWIELERVRHMLAFGDVSKRRLIEIPTGHQLKSSREALDAFKLIAVEAGRMALGKRIKAASPDIADLQRRRRAERRRIPEPQTDLRGFWRDYLVGRDGSLGMELVASTRSYRELMAKQVKALDLKAGETVLDLGCGVGPFPVHLLRAGCPSPLDIIEVDYVSAALRRARTRVAKLSPPPGIRMRYLASSLEVGNGRSGGVALQGAAADAILASLVLNYVKDPQALLEEMLRLLHPGGRLVLSSLRRDADVSGICVDGVAELRSGLGQEAFGEDERQLPRALQSFINEAGRLLDLEEQGFFEFWDGPELVAMAKRAGFAELETWPAFGTPPQAHILSGRRPAES
jgi:ubiquinone/menaquinone biosynthesis C-methylase UbiE/pimeloyl-ACP methyl ester carboxylesterase